MYETVKALIYAYEKIGCIPKEIQKYNGIEFSDEIRRKSKRNTVIERNILEGFCVENNIIHHFIKQRSPQHNSKVERSLRIDQDKFYKNMKFYSLEDLRYQGNLWNKRYNNLPKLVLGFKTPNEVELEKLNELFNTTGEIRCPKRLTLFES